MTANTIVELIKLAAVQAVKQMQPVEVVTGTVVEVKDPEPELRIQIDQQHILKIEDFIINTPIVSTLEKNDKLVLLKAQGGQQFVVLDKVV